MSVLDRLDAVERQVGEIGRTLASTDEKVDGEGGVVKEVRIVRQLVSNVQTDVVEIKTSIAVLKTKIAVWSGLGGLVGAGVVSAIVAVATKGFSG